MKEAKPERYITQSLTGSLVSLLHDLRKRSILLLQREPFSWLPLPLPPSNLTDFRSAESCPLFAHSCFLQLKGNGSQFNYKSNINTIFLLSSSLYFPFPACSRLFVPPFREAHCIYKMSNLRLTSSFFPEPELFWRAHHALCKFRSLWQRKPKCKSCPALNLPLESWSG